MPSRSAAAWRTGQNDPKGKFVANHRMSQLDVNRTLRVATANGISWTDNGHLLISALRNLRKAVVRISTLRAGSPSMATPRHVQMGFVRHMLAKLGSDLRSRHEDRPVRFGHVIRIYVSHV